MNDLVEVFEIWRPVAIGGEAISTDGKNMELVALIVNGQPIKLAKDFMLEKCHITKEESDRIIKPSSL